MSIPLRLENDRSDEFANFLETKRKREEDERRRQNILRSTRSQAQAINQRAKTARIDSRRRAMNVNSPMTPQFMRDQMNARAAQKEAVAAARASGLPDNRLSAVPMNAPTTPVAPATQPVQPAVQPVPASPTVPAPAASGMMGPPNPYPTTQPLSSTDAMGPLLPTDYLSEGARKMLPQKPAPPYEEIDPLIIDNANQTADLVDDLVRVLSDPDEAPVDEEVIPANMMMSSYPDFFTDPSGHLDAREKAQDLGFFSSLIKAAGPYLGYENPSEEEKAGRVQELIDAYTPKDTDPLAASQRSALYDAARERFMEDLNARLSRVDDPNSAYMPTVQEERAMSKYDSYKLRRLMEDATYGDFDELLDLVRRGDY